LKSNRNSGFQITASCAHLGNAGCDRLYFARNTIFKDAGLCFTRAAAIKTFGNAGCQYDRAEDMPISANDRAKVRRIVAKEAALGCGRKL
jgi:hypothetical protein